MNNSHSEGTPEWVIQNYLIEIDNSIRYHKQELSHMIEMKYFHEQKIKELNDSRMLNTNALNTLLRGTNQ
jgi:hypothetical protein